MNQRSGLIFIIIMAIGATATMGCNMTSGIDNPKSHDEMLNDALSKLDNGDCVGAATRLNGITPQDDPVLEMTGKALLCQAGAPIDKVLSAIGNPSVSDLTPIGTLANKLLPATAGADANIAAALVSFKAMSLNNPTERGAWIIYADLVRIATVMAKDSASQSQVLRSDISVNGCNVGTCTVANVANCTVTNMSDTDANLALGAIQDANNAAAAASLGTVGSFATNLNTLIPTASAAATRCLLYNQTLTQ